MKLTKEDILGYSQEQCPFVILSDNLKSWYGKIIKAHTDGEYNHAFMMVTPGMAASQNGRFESYPIDRYLNGQFRLKLWRNKHFDPNDRHTILQATNDRIRTHSKYDWLGIVGQALRNPWIQNPKKTYCSEAVAEILLDAGWGFGLNKPSPADINRLFKSKFGEMAGWLSEGVYDPNERG